MLQLSPTQVHFLKKYLLEQQLVKELQILNEPNCCELLGPPFNASESSPNLPLLTFFFRKFLVTFPLIVKNSPEKQRQFWQDVVEPFVINFNSKQISGSSERRGVSKRKRANKKLLSVLLLFYNSTLVAGNEMEYLTKDHYKASDTAKLEKFDIQNLDRYEIIGLNQFDKMVFVNDIYINIVAVRTVEHEQLRSWFKVQRQHNYEFVIQIVLRQGKECVNVFVNKYYGQFRTLENELKKELPGAMTTKIATLPHKEKHDEGEDLDMDGKSGVLTRERLRLALRGYLRELIKVKEIVKTNAFQLFILTDSTDMTLDDVEDYKTRVEHETKMLETQKEFQKETLKITTALSGKIESFKSLLIENPNASSDLLEEIGSTRSIKEASSVLQTFNEWAKLEIAATVYHLFLAQDSAAGFYQKCRKLHRWFPYSVVYAILRFTNPMKMILRVVDLLFLSIPRLPTWNKELREHSKSTGARNLCALMFIAMLNDDLLGNEKEIALLREDLKGFERYLQRIDNFVASLWQDVQDIKEEALHQQQDYFMTILTSELIGPPCDARLRLIQYSYNAFESGGDMEALSLYLNLKQYWQLQVRTKDKELLKQIWEEPEITQLLKTILEVFYNPIMSVFAKSNVHKAFKSAEKMIDEILKVVGEIRDEQYYLSPLQIYDRIKAVLDEHEDFLWNFLHDVYANDDQQVFLGFIKWAETFLLFVRVKFIDEPAVKLDIEIGDVDENLFVQQLDAKVRATLEKRRLFKEYYEAKKAQQDQIDQDWEKINNSVFGNVGSDDFGFSADDMDDLNNMNLEDEMMGGEHSRLEKMLIAKLKAIESSVGTSELDKIDIEKGVVDVLARLETSMGAVAPQG